MEANVIERAKRAIRETFGYCPDFCVEEYNGTITMREAESADNETTTKMFGGMFKGALMGVDVREYEEGYMANVTIYVQRLEEIGVSYTTMNPANIYFEVHE